MTTDRFEKRSARRFVVDGRDATLVGIAKGAGMIAPNMATTLAFVFTDAAVAPAHLQRLLGEEIDRTFNCVSVDGDTSTNDSVFVMASGAAGNRPIADDSGDGAALRQALHDVLDELSRLIVSDGEGAQHVVTIAVSGAPSRDAADRIARAIACSPLCKTAFFGADPNWGRLLSTIGKLELDFDHGHVSVAFDDVPLVRDSAGLGDAAEEAVHAVMKKPAYTIAIDLHAGAARAHHITCDLGHDYVTLNADYRS